MYPKHSICSAFLSFGLVVDVAEYFHSLIKKEIPMQARTLKTFNSFLTPTTPTAQKHRRPAKPSSHQWIHFLRFTSGVFTTFTQSGLELLPLGPCTSYQAATPFPVIVLSVTLLPVSAASPAHPPAASEAHRPGPVLACAGVSSLS